MHKDTVVGILGAVILVAAMVGIFYYEGTQVPGGTSTVGGNGSTLRVNWTSVPVDGPQQQGSTNEGGSSDTSVSLNQTNITSIEFMLQWTDDIPNSGPDHFRMTVTPPNGTNISGADAEGDASFSVNIPVGSAPNATTASALQLAQWVSTKGMGNWTVHIELTNAGDVGQDPPVPPPVPIPNVTDTGNGWTLMVHVSTYQAKAQP